MGGGASSAKPKRTPSYPAYMTETAPFPTRTTRRSQSSSDAAPKDAHHRARASKEERKHRLSGYSHNGSIGSMNGNGNGVEAWLEGGPGSLPGTPTRSPGSFGRHGSGGGGDLKRATSGASSDRLGSGGEAGEVVQQRTYAMVLCNRLEEEQRRREVAEMQNQQIIDKLLSVEEQLVEKEAELMKESILCIEKDAEIARLRGRLAEETKLRMDAEAWAKQNDSGEEMHAQMVRLQDEVRDLRRALVTTTITTTAAGSAGGEEEQRQRDATAFENMLAEPPTNQTMRSMLERFMDWSDLKCRALGGDGDGYGAQDIEHSAVSVGEIQRNGTQMTQSSTQSYLTRDLAELDMLDIVHADPNVRGVGRRAGSTPAEGRGRSKSCNVFEPLELMRAEAQLRALARGNSYKKLRSRLSIEQYSPTGSPSATPRAPQSPSSLLEIPKQRDLGSMKNAGLAVFDAISEDDTTYSGQSPQKKDPPDVRASKMSHTFPLSTPHNTHNDHKTSFDIKGDIHDEPGYSNSSTLQNSL